MRSDAGAEIVLLGTGVVGRAVVEILFGRRRPQGLRLVAVANRRGLVAARAPGSAALGELVARSDYAYLGLGEAPLDPRAIAELAAQPRARDDAAVSPPLDLLLDAFDRERGAPRILVDATASDGMADFYARALERGVHVVTANKKPLAGPAPAYARLFDASARGGKLRYEATVGAGLPIVETLKDLVRTGDEVRRIDCVLSGTLGFLCSATARGLPLSKAVAVARERGYSEPDPREDLGGADVARKAVILARELGAALEARDVALEPFVPRALLDAARPDTLDAHLAGLDAGFAADLARRSRRREKLVYLARIEADGAGGARAWAGPTALPAEHPAARLDGPGALVAFTTARYADEPLVVSGAGAGGAVTAAAIVGDALKVAGCA